MRASYLSGAGYLAAELQLPGRCADASYFGLPQWEPRRGPFKSVPCGFSLQECQVYDAFVPYTVVIPSLRPRPAEVLSFHVRSSEAAGSWLSVAPHDTEGSVLTRDRQMVRWF